MKKKKQILQQRKPILTAINLTSTGTNGIQIKSTQWRERC